MPAIRRAQIHRDRRRRRLRRRRQQPRRGRGEPNDLGGTRANAERQEAPCAAVEAGLRAAVHDPQPRRRHGDQRQLVEQRGVRGRRPRPVYALGLRHYVTGCQDLARLERRVARGRGVPLEAPVADLEAAPFARRPLRRCPPGVGVARVAPEDQHRSTAPARSTPAAGAPSIGFTVPARSHTSGGAGAGRTCSSE